MTLDRWFVIGNVFGAFWAFFFNTWDGLSGWKDYRKLRLTIAVIALVYIIGYLVLFFAVVERLQWSHVFVGISVLVWYPVWCGPPIKSIIVRRKIKQGEQAIEDSVTSSV